MLLGNKSNESKAGHAFFLIFIYIIIYIVPGERGVKYNFT